MLKTFWSGFWGRKRDGRVDLPEYDSALKEMTNFIPMPGGEAQKRPGLAFVKSGITSGRLESFIFSDGAAFVIGFKLNGFHLYKDDIDLPVAGAGDVPYLSFVSTTTDATLYPWVDDPLDTTNPISVYEIDIVQVVDSIYIMHKGMQTLKMQYDGSGFKTKVIDFADKPPYRLLQKTKTLSAVNADMQSGTEAVGGAKFIKIKGDFSNVNGGTLLKSEASGKAIIRWGLRTPGKDMGTSDMEALAEIIHKFDGTEGSLFIEGGGIVKLDPDDETFRGGAISLTATAVPKVAVELLETTVNKWVVTAGGAAPDEFFYDITAGVNMRPSAKPDTVYVDSVPYKEGTVGSLVAGEWGWGKDAADSLGVDTIYIFIAGPIDPDSLCTSELSQVRVFYVMNDPTFDKAELSDMCSADDFIAIQGGIVRVDGFPDVETIQGVVVDRLDTGTATYNWELYENAFGSSGTKVWPHRGTFHDGRLVYGNGEDIWMSDVNDPDRFTIDINPADSIVFNIKAKERHDIQWIESRDVMVVGTDLAEFVIGARGSILTPDNILVRKQTSYGSWNRWPLVTVGGDSIYFVDRSSTIIREMSFDFATDSYRTVNITRQNSEIFTQSGVGANILSLSYQPDPFPILWVVVANTAIGGNFPSDLWGCVIDKELGLYSWFKVAIPDIPAGPFYAISVAYVRRKQANILFGNAIAGYLAVQTDGSAIRSLDSGFMCTMPPIIDPKNGRYLSTSGKISYLDYYKVQLTNVPAQVKAAMAHLGTDPTIIKSYAASKQDLASANFMIPASGGFRTIPADYVDFHSCAGYDFTATLTPMRLEGGGERGPSQGIIKRISKLFVRLYGSMGGKVGPDSSTTEDIPNMDTPVDGDREVDFPNGWETDGFVSIISDDPVPFVVLALSAEINTSDPKK